MFENCTKRSNGIRFALKLLVALTIEQNVKKYLWITFNPPLFIFRYINQKYKYTFMIYLQIKICKLELIQHSSLIINITIYNNNFSKVL